MKCIDARLFLTQVSSKAITTPLQPIDLDFLVTNNYVLRTSQQEYNQLAAEVANLEQTSERLQQEKAGISATQDAMTQDRKKFLSYLYPLHGAEYKEQVREKMEADTRKLSQDQVPLTQDEQAVSSFIQKKSALDQLVQYNGEYVSLTSEGVIMLDALNARLYRVQDMEFSDFIQELAATDAALRGIADRAKYFVSSIRSRISLSSQTT